MRIFRETGTVKIGRMERLVTRDVPLCTWDTLMGTQEMCIACGTKEIMNILRPET